MSTDKHPAELQAGWIEQAADFYELPCIKQAAIMLLTIPELEAEIKGLTSTVIQQGEILRAVVIAVRGTPPENTSWSSHDAAELVRGVVSERDALQADADRYRWLRDQHNDQAGDFAVVEPGQGDWKTIEEIMGTTQRELDGAIDAARGAA